MIQMEQASIFIILKEVILEIAFTRKSEKSITTSGFLLLAASQFILMVKDKRQSWKKWVFFLLNLAEGEGFRLDFSVVYVKTELIRSFLVNEYDLTVNIPDYIISLRINDEINKYKEIIEENRMIKLLSKKNKLFHEPFSKRINTDIIRSLTLDLFPKKQILYSPPLDDFRIWIVSWDPQEESVKNQEYGSIMHYEHINLVNIPPFIELAEILRRNWNNFRNPKLEQPFGLICPECKTTFQPNIFSTLCSSCKSTLIRA